MLESDGQGSKFFRDQNVFEQDLNNMEYTKTQLVRETTKNTMENPGVCALDKSTDTDLRVTASLTDITVRPGTGIDDLGRLITVPSNTTASGSISTDPYYHPAWPTNVITHSDVFPGPENGTFCVYISYTTQEGLPETDDDGVSHNSRVYDSYTITIIRKVGGTPPTHGLLLAEYDVASGDIQNGEIIDLRILYSAATPTAVTVESHADNFHVDGIGDTDFLDYTDDLDAETDDYYVGSLGFKIYNNLGGAPLHSRVNVRPSINTYVNLGGKYLTGTLTTTKAEWTSDDDYSGWYVVYVDANKLIHRSDRATAADGNFNLPTGSFSICKVYWDVLVAPRELSLVEDLREWGTTKGEILGNQFSSGSLTLNKNAASINDMVRDTGAAALKFINDANYLEFANSQFKFSKQLEICGRLLVGGNLYTGCTGAGNLKVGSLTYGGNLLIEKGVVYVYFNNGVSPGSNTATMYFNNVDASLKYNGTYHRFEFSSDVRGENFYINADNSDNDAKLEFGLPTAGEECLKWNKTESRFEFSKKLAVLGDLKTSNDLYINYDGSSGDRYIYFYTGSPTGASIKWGSDQFTFSHPVNMNTNKITNVADPTSNQDAVTKKYMDDNTISAEVDTLDTVCDRGNTTDQSITVNDLTANNCYASGNVCTKWGGGSYTDAYYYFLDTSHYLKWEYNPMDVDYFEFSHQLRLPSLNVSDLATFGKLRIPTSKPSSPQIGDMYLDLSNGWLGIRKMNGYWHYIDVDYVIPD